MKLDHKDWINLLLFLAVLILMFIIIVKIQGEGVQCTLNPLEFGANQLREQNRKEIMCQCNLLTDKLAPTLYFDHNSSGFESSLISGVDSGYGEINFTMFEDNKIEVLTGGKNNG